MSPTGHPSDAQLDAATWCRHLIPDGSVYAFLADHRHQLFPPELFADVARQGGGHPSVPAKGGRTIRLHPQEDELRAARRQAVTRSFQQRYRRWRPMVERSIAWLVANGCRRVPYRGIQRNELWWSLRVAAVNLRRLLMLGLARRDGVWALA
jgi:hypothetical protein